MTMNILLMIPAVIVVTFVVDYAILYIISFAGKDCKEDRSELEDPAGKL